MMARSQSPDYDDRKSKIQANAAQIFASVGFHKASIGEITQACGISKSLVYHYFPSKQDILYHTLKDHVTKLNTLARSILKRDLGPEDSLQAIVFEYLEIYSHTVAEHHLLITELSALNDEQRAEITALQNEVVNVFADLAEKLSPAPLERHKAKRPIAFLLLGMINWTYTWYKSGGDISANQLSHMIYQMLIGGLKNLRPSIFEEEEGA